MQSLEPDIHNSVVG